MDDAHKMNASNEILFAKELTIKAIENGLISKFSDAGLTAKEVTKFYKTALETINQD